MRTKDQKRIDQISATFGILLVTIAIGIFFGWGWAIGGLGVYLILNAIAPWPNKP